MIPDTIVVDAPSEKANSELNGSKGFIERRGKVDRDAVLVQLLDGPEAGRLWWFRERDLVSG